MVTHGSESYFVIGEGLLGEASAGGTAGRRTAPGRWRPRPPVTAAAASVPPFRFSRMGPSGAGRQLGEPNRKKVGAAMAEPGGGQSQIPAGFTYLGQFLDHDLTFDKTNVMLGANVTPAQLLQARSPSLDLDSLYGAGPAGPGVGEVLRGRRPPPEERASRSSRRRTASTCRAERATRTRRSGRRSSRTRATTRTSRWPRRTRAMIRFHNRVVDTQLGSRAGRAEVRQGARDRDEALPVDDPHRLPAADLPARRGERRLQQRAQGVRGGSHPDGRARRCRSSSRWRRSGSATRWCVPHYNWNKNFDKRQRDAARSCSSSRRSAARSGARRGSLTHLGRGLPPAVRLRRGEQGRPRGAGGQVQPRDADRHADREPAAAPAAADGRAAEQHPGFNDVRRNLAFRNLTRARMVKLATGQQMATFLKNKGVNLTKLTKAQIRDGNSGADLSSLTQTQRQALRAATRRCGSTCCARRS